MAEPGFDVAYSEGHAGETGRFHHLIYALDQREDILRAADLFLENGVHIETGPRNLVELANAGARLTLRPDWPAVTCTERECKRGQAWGLKTIETFHTQGTRPAGRKN